MKHVLSIRFDFLDQQLVDRDGLPVGRVEDLELGVDDGEGPVIEAVLTGAEALGQRIDGVLGGSMASAAGRLRSPEGHTGPARVDASLVESAGAKVELTASIDELDGVAMLQKWLAAHVVGPIPGSQT